MRPGRNGLDTPMTPDRRTTGTTGMSVRKRAGSNMRSPLSVRATLFVICFIRLDVYAPVTPRPPCSRRRYPCPGMVINRSLFSLGIDIALHLRPATTRKEAMDPKLTLLFVLIGAVVALSHLTDDNLTRMRRQLADRRWRNFVRISRKI
jgi:hypothetical protein